MELTWPQLCHGRQTLQDPALLDHGAYQPDSNVSKSLLGHYRFYKSISEVPSFQDVMEKVNLSAQLCVFY